MTRIALLFSGQGAQKPGMGLDFMTDPLFSATVAAASEASHLDIATILKSANGELKQTANVQPALVTVSVGIYRMLQRDLPKLPVAGMVGLSLGEYGALIASGALAFDAGIALLTDRGRYMQADADAQPSSMAALIDPDLALVEKILGQSPAVTVANYNSPQQVVIGGPTAAVKEAADQLKTAQAAKRVVVLRVSGAFHTPLFNNARQKMHRRLADVNFAEPRVPVLSNTTSRPFAGNQIKEIMERQLAVPTHFGDDLQYLVDHEGTTATLEIGPGKALSRFARQVDRHLDRSHIATLTDYQNYVEDHQEWT